MGKAKKKAAKTKSVAVADATSNPYAELTDDQLNAALDEIMINLQKAKNDRNYVQVERDTVQTFHDITVGEIQVWFMVYGLWFS